MFKLWVAITYIPLVTAAPQTQGFPDVPFYIFSNFIQDTFSSNVSLATVLLVLFSLTENTELLQLFVDLMALARFFYIIRVICT